MKLKKYLSSLLAIALLASCSNEGILDNNTPIDNVPEGAVEFNLSFPGRTFQPTTYGDNVQPITNGTFAALNYEKALSHVDVFVFENITENGNDKPGKLVSINKVRFIDNNVNNVEADNTPATTTGATGKFFVRNISGKVHLVAAANLLFDEAKKESLVGKSFSDVANTLVTQSPDTHNYFPMVSEPKKVEVPSVGAATPNPISFLLERLSVRIDIQNESGTVFGGHPFYPTKFQTSIGALNQSYLMNTLETPLANGDGNRTKYVNQTEWKPISYNKHTKQVFGQIYTYENRSNEFILTVIGNIDGKAISVDVPFNQPLVRNTRYLVTLRATPESDKILFNIEVVDWNNGGEVIVEASELKEAPEVKKFEKTAGTTANWKPAENKLEIDKNGAAMRLVVKSNVVPMLEVKDTFIPWVKFEETTLNPGEQEADAEVKAYNLTFSKNFDSYNREAKLVLHTEGTQDKANRTVIKVTQDAQLYADIVNPLAILSKYYVSEVGNFDEVEGSYIDERLKKGIGLWYQFGRNNPLDYKEPVTSRGNQLEINSPILSDDLQNKYSYGSWNTLWTSEPITTATKWQDLVNKSGAGTDYTGRNTVVPGDPSKDGWKLPNIAEAAAIFPLEFFGTNINVNKPDLIEEGISFKGSPANYKADYKGARNNIVYAIKMKEGKDGKYLTAFRYEVKRNTVTITSRWLGKVEGEKPENAITEVAKEQWWNTNNGSDIVRVYQKTVGSFTDFAFALNEIVDANAGTGKSPDYKLAIVVMHRNLGCGWSGVGASASLLPIRAK